MKLQTDLRRLLAVLCFPEQEHGENVFVRRNYLLGYFSHVPFDEINARYGAIYVGN